MLKSFLRGTMIAAMLLVLPITVGFFGVATEYAKARQSPPPPPAFQLFYLAPQPLGGTQDDTPQILAAINAMPDGSVMKFPGGGAVYNLSRIPIYHRTCVKLLCEAGSDLASLDKSGCTFKYNGVQGDKAFVDFNASHRCWIEGIRLDASGATYPQCLISIDTWTDPNPPNTLPATTMTQTTVKDMILVAPAKANSGCDGVHINQTSATNGDFTRILHCNITSSGNVKLWGDGVVSWSSNQKGGQVVDSSVSWAINGFHINAGVLHISNCFGTGNQVDLRVDSSGGPCILEQSRFEQSGMALLCGNLQDADLLLHNCEWGNLGQNTPTPLAITNVANTTNPTITCSSNVNITPGQYVYISGVSGATGVNGTFQVQTVSGATFTITLSTPPGNYLNGGTAAQQTYVTQCWSRFSHIDGCVFGSALPAGCPPMLMFQPSVGSPFGTLRLENNRCTKIVDNSGNQFSTAIESNNWFRAY